jgi:hypothetical protein
VTSTTAPPCADLQVGGEQPAEAVGQQRDGAVEVGAGQPVDHAEYLDLTTVPDRVALLAGLISHLG